MQQLKFSRKSERLTQFSPTRINGQCTIDKEKKDLTRQWAVGAANVPTSIIWEVSVVSAKEEASLLLKLTKFSDRLLEVKTHSRISSETMMIFSAEALVLGNQRKSRMESSAGMSSV